MNDDLKLRFKIVFSIFGIICAVIIIKLYILSIARHDFFDKLSYGNTIKTEVLVPMRGQILDRFDTPIAINELGFSISLKTKLKAKDLQKELNFIKRYIIDADIDDLKQEYINSNSVYRRTPVELIDFIPYAEMQRIYPALSQSHNIVILPVNKRFYPGNSSAAHVVGYIGASDNKDVELDPVSKYTKIIGKQGLEKQYNTFLQGNLGYKKIQVNSLNQQLKIIDESPAIGNNDMQITIDMRLQDALDEIYEDKFGAAIIMDATNGEILAAGSYPEYNINDFVEGISYKKYKEMLDNPYKPLINKLINGQYPPGSVAKMGMALAIAEFSGVSENTQVSTPYFIEVGGHKFRDWKIGGHGKADLVKALAQSVDVYFYKLAPMAGISNIANVMQQMGFGELSGIDLPYENKGIFPTPEWKMRTKGEQWVLGDTILSSIGQGSFLATPVQIARYSALIATGKLVTPHFVKKLGDKDVVLESQNVLSDVQLSKLKYLRQGMYEACSSARGTAYHSTRQSKVKLACKTGTSQVVSIPQDVIQRQNENEMEYFKRSHSWITAFVPANDPKYVITLLVEHGGGGSRNGPLLAQIANKMQSLKYFNAKNTKNLAKISNQNSENNSKNALKNNQDTMHD